MSDHALPVPGVVPKPIAESLTISSALTEDSLIKKKKAAKRLDISIRTLDRLVADGRLEKVFVGASPRFRNSDIDRIIAEGL